jgi:hypothetical protein
MDIQKEFENAKFDVMENTFDALVKVAGYSEYKTYDHRAGMRAFKRFQNLKHSYGCIKEFAEYLYNISRYFKVKEYSDLLRDASKKLNRFAESYSMLL